MPDRRHLPLLLALLAAGALTVLIGCGSDDSPTGSAKVTGTCVECHTDAELLQATADPVDPPVDDGDSGET